MLIASLLIISYLLGSIPSGFLIGKYFADTDIRTAGSKNIGATNVTRLLGKKLGIITLIADIMKAMIAVIAVYFIAGYHTACFAGLFAVIGHIYPVWLKFKGGKGVATALAVYAVLYFPLMVIFILAWGAIFYLYKISSLSAVTAVIISTIFALVFAPHPLGIIALIINSLILVRHESNIKRLIRGEEEPIK